MISAKAAPHDTPAMGSTFVVKVFYAFAALAVLSFGISAGGKYLGRSIALAGHTDSTVSKEVVIGNDVLSVPANMIRFEEQRRNGVAARLDLYLRWPQLDGYSDSAREDFNHANGRRDIIFLSFTGRIMSRDMSGRLEPIYSSMLVKPGNPGPGGTEIYGFDDKSGYLNEVLVVARPEEGEPFVARCLVGESASDSLAPCERDIHLGEQLSVIYRFPREILTDWQDLDDAIHAKVASLLKTGTDAASAR